MFDRFSRPLAFVLALATGASACGGRAAPHAAAPAPAKDVPLTAPPAPAASEEGAAVPIFPDDAVKGPRDASVTIVVFSDFECPACAMFAQGIGKILARYPSTDTRLVYKHFPLRQHEHARMLAEISQGVLATRGVESFFRFHDGAFAQQGKGMDETIALRIAAAAGASPEEIKKGLEDKRWSAKIDRDMAQGTRVGLRGTPTILVNGIDVEDEDELKQAIDDQLTQARALRAKGVPADRVYTQLADANVAKVDKARAAADERRVEDLTVWRVPVGSSPVLGPKDARVTIVEFSDFQCPFCKNVEPTLKRVREEYGPLVRIVWKDQPLPFHPRALPAARFAREARRQKGDDTFWAVHDQLFAGWPNHYEDSDFETIAKETKLDVAKAMAAAKSTAPDKGLEEDMALADDVEVQGTPHFFINGRRVVGNQPFDEFKRVIDQEIEKAKALVATGVAPAALYDTIMKDAKSAPLPERVSVPLPTKAPVRGAPQAPVVIQQFSEFQCPYCKKVEPTLDELLKANPGKIKIVFRHLPLSFHANAPLAAEAAEEAFVQKGNDGFAKMRTLLFEHQGDPGGLEREALEGYAKTVGLDVKRFAKALDTHANEAAIEADKKAADDAGIRGTPAFVIGPYLLTGAQPLRKFQRVVNLALTESPTKGPAK